MSRTLYLFFIVGALQEKYLAVVLYAAKRFMREIVMAPRRVNEFCVKVYARFLLKKWFLLLVYSSRRISAALG